MLRFDARLQISAPERGDRLHWLGWPSLALDGHESSRSSSSIPHAVSKSPVRRDVRRAALLPDPRDTDPWRIAPPTLRAFCWRVEYREYAAIRPSEGT